VPSAPARIDPARDEPAPADPGRASPDRADLDVLRASIARLEADTAEPAGRRKDHDRGRAPVPLGAPDLDTVLGGGLKPNALHEIRSADADGPLAFGFALALLARLSDTATGQRPALIVTTLDGAGEWGRPYGPGLTGFGLDPARLLIVEARRAREALWAAEEALTSRALAAVVAEIRGDPAIVDLTATRRLALRAARGGITALLVRPGTADGLTAARTRWRVAPRPAADPDAPAPTAPAFTLDPPAWSLDLERNATRPGGRFDLVWSPHDRLFAPADIRIGAGEIAPVPRPASAPSPGRAPSGRTPSGRTARQDTEPAILPFRQTG